jgi:hypothetical protein
MSCRAFSSPPALFLQTDPIPGGSCNSYDYACQDPINNYDLGGTDCWFCTVLGGELAVALPNEWNPVGWATDGAIAGTVVFAGGFYLGYKAGSYLANANSHGGGASSRHGDSGRRRDQLAPRIEQLRRQLAELKRNQGSRTDKNKVKRLIDNLTREGDDAARGTEHHN